MSTNVLIEAKMAGAWLGVYSFFAVQARADRILCPQ